MEEERQDDQGIRARKGRVVTTRGPIIWTIEAVALLTGVAAVVALVISLTGQQSKIDTIQNSRARAALDSCRLLQHLILDATPPGREAEARAYVRRAGLENCAAYARKVVSAP